LSKLRKWAPPFVFIYILLFYSWIFFWREREKIDMVVLGSNLFQLLAPIIACILLINTFLHTFKKERMFWLLLSFGCFSYGIGQGIWSYYEIYIGDAPIFSKSIVLFWILQEIFFLSAFVIKIKSLRQSVSMTVFVLDILTIMVVMASLSWEFIIQPMLSSVGTASLWIVVSYIALPISDLGLLFGFFSFFLIGDEQISRKALLLISLGFLINVYFNTQYAYLAINNNYQTGSHFDLFWSLSFLFIGIAGLYSEVSINQAVKQNIYAKAYKYRHFLPYLFVLVLLVFAIRKHYQILEVLTYGLSITIVLLITRLNVTLLKNEELLRNMQRLTEKLSMKNFELKNINQALSEKEQQLQDVFDNLDAVIWSVDYRTNKVMISSGVEDIFGFQRRDLLADPAVWKKVIHPEDMGFLREFDFMNNNTNPLIEFRIIQQNGEIKWVQVVRTNVVDEKGQLIKAHAVITDITEHKEAEEKIEYMAYHDELTGLPNRNLFYRSLKQELKKAKNHQKKLALLFIDLDRFKGINDTLGHLIGDQLLQDVAKRLQKCVQDNGIVCRIGGDEFTIVLPSNEREDSERLAQKIIRILEKSFSIQGNELFITPSIGISLFPTHGEMEEELIKKADMAMYHAKARGKNNYYVYTVDLDETNSRKMKLENALRKAIDNNELSLHYQPKVELASEMIVGTEALIRWNNPTLGNISPVEFIPLAEETGMIHQIGEWVLQTACEHQKEWQKKGVPSIPVSVNVSAGQLRKDFIEKVDQIIKETRVDPRILEFEITESVMQNMNETSKILQGLKQLGVNLSIDDFGTGYSSLSYLKNLPVDCVKIDKSFIDDILETSNGGVMVKTIIDMGRNLNFTVCAEGIETEQQKKYLKQHNCTLGQGYLFSPPLPAERIVPLLEEKGVLQLPY